MDLKELQEKVAALEADKKSLQASKDELNTKLTEANDKLTKFSSDARTGSVKQLFSDIGREYKEDDAQAKAFSSMPQEAFDATATVLREQFKKPAADTSLFSHTATNGSGTQAPQTSAAPANPLMADAEKRATTFSKRAA